MLRRVPISCLFVLSGSLIAIGQKPPAMPSAHSPSFRISGTAVNVVDGQPLSAVEVTISPTERRTEAPESQAILTGADGRFVFESLAPGKYSLAGHRQGFSVQFYQQHEEFSTAIAVGPGLVSENLSFALTPDASISGLVLDEENEPVRAGQVILFNRDEHLVHLQFEGSLDEQGRYHFGHLRPGTYFVAVVAQPWYAQDPLVIAQPGSLSVEGAPAGIPVSPEPSGQADTTTPSPLDVAYPATYYPAATEPENAAPIPLRAGERAVADVNLRAVTAVHLRIRTAGSDATHPAGAIVQQRLFDTVIPIQARTQPASPGVLNISGIPPGHLLLDIRSFNGQESTGINKEVDVSADSEIDATEDSASSVMIKGVIRLQGASPFPSGAYIRFTSQESGETFGAQASDKGEFEIQQAIMRPTNYSVAIYNVAKFVVQSVSATGATVTGHTILLPHAGAVHLAITMSEGLSRVNGTVLRDDKPVSESMVLLVPQHPEDEPSLFRRDQSDSDGTFSLYQILPGRYTVVAIENGWELDWHNPAILKPYLQHGEILEVAASKTYKISLKLQSQDTPAMPTASAIK